MVLNLRDLISDLVLTLFKEIWSKPKYVSAWLAVDFFEWHEYVLCLMAPLRWLWNIYYSIRFYLLLLWLPLIGAVLIIEYQRRQRDRAASLQRMTRTSCIGMSELSFYQVCLKAVARHTKAGIWNSCPVNPFLSLPSKIIDDVMESGKRDFRRISEIFLPLTSGSLTRLDFCGYNLEGERDLFQEIIERNGFKSLRHLSLCSLRPETMPLINAAIRSCSKLEEVHSWQFLDFDIFRNCKELRVLKFHVSFRRILNADGSLDLSSLSSLRNLQVFDSFESNGDAVAAVLQYCPYLISVGCNDSLNTLEKIHAGFEQKYETDNTTKSAQLQLKMCLWGKNKDILFTIPADKYFSYKSSFPEKMRIAVSLCPFVEKLIIYVSHKDSLESLRHLKHLTHLKISFWECDGNYKADFFSLLQVIGGKLKHLTFNDKNRIQVDVICDLCPRLESLELGRFATLSGPVKPQSKLFLKKLHIMDSDQNALRFLLSSCKALQELTIDNALCLEDSLLIEVLKLNPLERLRISDIKECHLSEKGFQLFLESAVSLEEVNFSAHRQELSPSIKKLIRELNLTRVKNRRAMKRSFNQHINLFCSDFNDKLLWDV
ncbi:hypothetical protein HNY73_006874 [Argiope bruennichi]|uniref:Uncharacterized protein n=1 Tax=Argiope bruennichi TaxID=94029 RepID=A0A8T0FHS7_ARGBR|nr:hypothetical protein HNY73_006874 [Argiope bruennichi]